jgi:hypothetical protein
MHLHAAQLPVTMLATRSMDRPNSRLINDINGINGARANHAKKQTKNAIHVRWKARMGTVRRLKRSIRVALSAIVFPQNKKASRETQPMTEFRGRRCPKSPSWAIAEALQ